MIRRFAAALCFLMAPLSAHAADIQNLDLGKDTQVWFVEDHTVPIVSLVVSFPAGSAYDPAGKAGLASFTTALLDEGAGNMDSKAFHDALASKAIRMSAGVERDYMTISIRTLSENLPEAMRLMQLALTRPRFDAEAVARVRTQMIQSLEQGENEPPTVARRAFTRAFFNGHAYGHPGNGEISTISTISSDDLRAFARSHWVRGGLKVALAGDITAPVAIKLIGETFKPISASRPAALAPIGKLGQPGVQVIDMKVPQPTIVFGLPGIMRQDPDFIPGYVANYILGGGGFSSRLTDEVRVKRGLTYGVSTGLSSYNRAALMQGGVATRADAVNQTIQVVRDTMRDFAANGATQTELADAKTYLTGSFPIAFASNNGIASQLSAFQRAGLDVDYVKRRNALIEAVTLDDIKRVAKKLFDPARLTVVVAGTPTGGRGAPERAAAPVRPAPATPAPAAKPSVVKPAAKTPVQAPVRPPT